MCGATAASLTVGERPRNNVTRYSRRRRRRRFFSAAVQASSGGASACVCVCYAYAADCGGRASAASSVQTSRRRRRRRVSGGYGAHTLIADVRDVYRTSAGLPPRPMSSPLTYFRCTSERSMIII